jgi:hypothetical protein
MLKRNLLIASLALVPTQSYALDICEALARQNVHALEDPDSMIMNGEYDTGITQYRIDKKSGEKWYCSHGGYCYPADSLELTNCEIGPPGSYGDDDDAYSYRAVQPIRSKIPPATLRIYDLENSFLTLGLCSACAAQAADAYINKPRSKCARIAKSALEGDPKAIELINQSAICN